MFLESKYVENASIFRVCMYRPCIERYMNITERGMERERERQRERQRWKECVSEREGGRERERIGE